MEVTIRACSIFTIADGKFTDRRIYVDNSPVNSYLSWEESVRPPNNQKHVQRGIPCAG